jgi:hypothetical protein
MLKVCPELYLRDAMTYYIYRKKVPAGTMVNVRIQTGTQFTEREIEVAGIDHFTDQIGLDFKGEIAQGVTTRIVLLEGNLFVSNGVKELAMRLSQYTV